jgi:hypothetical protein
MDYFRHYLKYNSQYNGPSGNLAGHIAAMEGYVPVGAQASNFVPALTTYEGGVALIVPGPVETGPVNGYTLTGQLAHDTYYDPEIYNAQMAWFQMLQQAGIALAQIFDLSQPRYAENNRSQPEGATAR